MSWNDRLLVSQAIGCTTGLILALLFVLLLSRAPRHSIRLRTLALLISSGVTWNLAGLVSTLLHLNGASMTDTWVRVASGAASISGGILPIGLLVLWRERLEGSSTWLCSRWFLWTTTAIATVLTWLSIDCLLRSASPTWIVREGEIYQIAFTAVAGAVALLRGPHRGPSVVVYALATAGGACMMALPMVLSHVLRPSPETRFWLVLTKQDGGLLMILGCFFLFGTFRFAHVFVKQSLRILVIAIGAPFLWFALSGISPDPRGFLIASGAIAAAWFAFAPLDRGIGMMVDRWLLRRPDYTAILKRTREGMHPLDSEAAILRTVADAVRTTMALEECVIVPAAEAVAESGLMLREGEIHETCHHRDIRVLVPVRSGKTVSYVIALTQQYRQNILSGEIQFLLTMASQLGSRLESLRFEQERLERQNREARLHSEIIQAELKALRAQINPHFLFNSLNAIADLIVADPERAEEMTLRLAKVFRYVLTNSDRQLASVAEEMEFLRSYLGIEEARFGGRLRVSFDVDQGVHYESIPCLLLQPVVENAIKHGLAPKVGDGHLAISARHHGSYLCLEVQDDGLGPPPRPAQEAYGRASTGLGLRNVTDRLKTLYEGRANLQFTGEPMRGSRVTILIPRTG